VFVNDSQVIITDIETSNGVIHVIDAVLIPPEAVPAALPGTGGVSTTSSSLLLLMALGMLLVAGGFGLLLFRVVTNKSI
jgi:hypothetical protein